MGNGNARVSLVGTPCSTEYTLYILINQSSQKVLVAQHNPLPCEDCREFREKLKIPIVLEIRYSSFYIYPTPCYWSGRFLCQALWVYTTPYNYSR